MREAVTHYQQLGFATDAEGFVEGLKRWLTEVSLEVDRTKPDTIHADTQGQNLPVFALSHLLGIKLMPRIRNWKDLKLYRPNKEIRYKHIGSLFCEEAIDWELIQTHWQDLLQVVLPIKGGRVLPSMLLRKLTSYSRKNRLYQAFRRLLFAFPADCLLTHLIVKFFNNLPI